MNPQTRREPSHLDRKFGLLEATALNMTNMIGIGPFITIPLLMSAMGGPQALLGWITALVIVIADGLVWAELGAALPGSGGSYRYLLEGFGPQTYGRLMAFLFIWQFILSGPLEIASGYIGFSQYLAYFWPITPGESRAINSALGLAAIFLLYRQTGPIAKITIGLWLATMVTVVGVIFAGATHFNSHLAFDFPPGAFNFSLGFLAGLGASARFGIYDYLGYYDVCYIGEEVREPAKVIPKSIIISVAAVGLIYIAINLSIIGIVPWRTFVPATDPPAPVVSLLMEKVYGQKAASAFTCLVLLTAFGSVFALLLGYSRIPYAAAVDGNFFRVFSRLHSTKNFPSISLLVIGMLSILFSFMSLSWVIDALITTRIIVQFIGQIGAVVILRRSGKPMPYRMWFYPLPCVVALAGWVFLFATSGEKTIGLGVLTLILGIIFFFVWARITSRWPFGGIPDGTVGIR